MITRIFFKIITTTTDHWRSGTARGFLPQGCGFVSHPVDRLSTEPVCVGSRLHKPVVYTKKKRPGRHRRQMEARSRVRIYSPCMSRHEGVNISRGACLMH
jgi:hypothetical protein